VVDIVIHQFKAAGGLADTAAQFQMQQPPAGSSSKPSAAGVWTRREGAVILRPVAAHRSDGLDAGGS
jgi:hypothetical protein